MTGTEKADDSREPPEVKTRTPFGRLVQRIEHNWIEIAAAALLALATVMSAYSAFQASKWGGNEVEHYNKANAELIESTELADQAGTETSIDVEMISNYLNAYIQGNNTLAQLYETTAFSDELKAAYNAWIAARTAGKPNLPKTPFGMPEYKNKHLEQSKELKRKAEAEAQKAKTATKNSNNHILLTVLFASVLFFAGIATKFASKGVKLAMLTMGMVIFVASVTVILLQP